MPPVPALFLTQSRDQKSRARRLKPCLTDIAMTPLGQELLSALEDEGIRIDPRDAEITGGRGEHIISLVKLMRKSLHLARGLDPLGRAEQPDHALLLYRAQEADAFAHAGMVAHQLRLLNDETAWKSLPKDISQHFKKSGEARPELKTLFDAFFGSKEALKKTDTALMMAYETQYGRPMKALLQAAEKYETAEKRQKFLQRASRKNGLSFLLEETPPLAQQRFAEYGFESNLHARPRKNYLGDLYGIELKVNKINPLLRYLNRPGEDSILHGCAALKREILHAMGRLEGRQVYDADSLLVSYRRQRRIKKAFQPNFVQRIIAGFGEKKSPAMHQDWKIVLSHGQRKLPQDGSRPAPRPGDIFIKSCPTYRPRYWNRERIQKSTNCYCYAADDPDGHENGVKQTPGEYVGKKKIYLSLEGRGIVEERVALEGMIPIGSQPVAREGYYLVALALDPGRDYHWYRQGKNGLWSHKPGHDEVRDIDESGNPIHCPEACDRGRYKEFWGYFLVPEGGLTVGKKPIIPPKPPKSEGRSEAWTRNILKKGAEKLGIDML